MSLKKADCKGESIKENGAAARLERNMRCVCRKIIGMINYNLINAGIEERIHIAIEEKIHIAIEEMIHIAAKM